MKDANTPPEKAEPELVEVTLKKPHTHAGEDHPAGAKIKVNAKQKAWLASPEMGVI